ncbi:MAG: hypothetical protein IJ946_03495 [Clostridia bacterium]|nr:hypothetical protein [Clostridia bacterium]
MDKETLSNYGWVVICVLVLVVMIALATPFGKYIAEAVKNTTSSLFTVSQKALNTGLGQAAQVTVKDVEDIVYNTVS